jgi:hypothetical protein
MLRLVDINISKIFFMTRKFWYFHHKILSTIWYNK